MDDIPSDLKYDKEHTYVRLEGNIAPVAISFGFLQRTYPPYWDTLEW